MKLYAVNSGVNPDDKDQGIANEKLIAFNLLLGPRVGDFAQMPDGSLERFSHHWGDSLQTTDGKYGASFYLGKGYVSFSGGLNPSISLKDIQPTWDLKDGHFWFFHHNFSTAHNGIGIEMPCRVYKITA